MEDVLSKGSPTWSPNPKGLISEIISCTDRSDDDHIYDRTRFRKDKAKHRHQTFYQRRKVVVERGVDITDFDERTPRIRAVLEV